MDKVLISQLKITTVIGVYEWEKKIQQQLLIDIEMAWDTRRAAADDDYSHALCYDSVAKRLTAIISEKPIQLIETVAQLCADCLMNEYNVPWVKIKVMKPEAVAEAATVAVEIERGRW